MTRVTCIAAMGLALLGCRDDPPYEGAFDVPVAVSVMPTAVGPYTEPVGLAANSHGGSIALLATKQGRFLSDDASASFLRGNWVPTGGDRVLTSVTWWAPGRYDLHVLAGDASRQTLVRVPWVVGSEELIIDGETRTFPVETSPTASEVCFVPAGQVWDPVAGGPCPGDSSVNLADLTLKRGYTTTETWAVTWAADRQSWRVIGSRSGRQEFEAHPGEPFVGDKRRVAFTIRGDHSGLAEGDGFVFGTDNGLVEIDVGGVPVQLATSPVDGNQIAMIVEASDGSGAHLTWFDPSAGTTSGPVTLGAGSSPTRFEFDTDGTLWVADSSYPAAWEVPTGSQTATEHPLPFRTLDIAPLIQEEQRLLFLASDDGQTVWRYDAVADAVLDINPSAPGDQGMDFGVPVNGISAIPTRYRYPERSEFGEAERLEGRGVAVALNSGVMVFMEEDTGCLVQDSLGPRTSVTQQFTTGQGDVSPNFDLDFNTPQMERNTQNDRHVQVNACAGIARADRWEVRYDATVGGWRVESVTQGEQQELAFEDERYQSDQGEISFTIRSGITPSQHGWAFSFTIDNGALTANGDGTGDGQADIFLGNPGDPVGFQYLAGVEGEKTERAYVLLPAMAADHVARISPETAAVEVQWD